MGIPDRHWRFTDLNSNYELCETYPSTLIVPNVVNNDTLRQCAGFRVKQRLPVLCWRDHVGFSARRRIESDNLDECVGIHDPADKDVIYPTMLRSSQPKMGLRGVHSTADQVLLREMARASGVFPLFSPSYAYNKKKREA